LGVPHCFAVLLWIWRRALLVEVGHFTLTNQAVLSRLTMQRYKQASPKLSCSGEFSKAKSDRNSAVNQCLRKNMKKSLTATFGGSISVRRGCQFWLTTSCLVSIPLSIGERFRDDDFEGAKELAKELFSMNGRRL
jgi:hypothetical protein